MLSEATRVREDIQRGATREQLQHLLPPGGARNALDCAFWDLEAKRAGRPVWELAGLDRPRALRSTLTLGADSPEAMAKAALAIDAERSEEHTSELQSLMRNSYAVVCLKNNKPTTETP